jgi:AcrR family transcriptional regulator
MPRPNRQADQRRKLLPVVAQTFAELGYRRTTTAELARRCAVQENILYRLWPDKKAMFIAAIGYVFDKSLEIWSRVLASQEQGSTPAERLLAYEATHHGEFGHYRIVFAGLSETDDPDVRAALVNMYQGYQRFLREHISAHRAGLPLAHAAPPDPTLTAWAVVGLGTIANIGRELGLVSETKRRQLFTAIGRLLLTGM